MKKTFFEEPAQVVALVKNNVENCLERIVGIAFRDIVICSCCGGEFSIEENVVEFESILSWEPFNEEIAPDVECGFIGVEDED